MADNFGIKLGVEGEKQFKNALRDINSSFKVLGSEMKLVESRFDKNENSIESYTEKNKVLNRQIEAQQDKVELLRQALENSSQSFGENDRRTQRWATQLNNAQAELNKMERNLKENEDALEDVAHEFDNAEEEADEFSDELKRTGREASESGEKFKKLGSSLKTIGIAIGASMAAIGTAAVAAGKKLTDTVNEVVATGDEIDKMSQRLGLSREGYQEWAYVLSQSGVDINSVQMGMKTLTNTIDDARNGTQNAVDKFSALGISMEDIQGKSREEIFSQAITGLQNMTDETKKAALANDLFGRSGQEMLPLLNSSAEGTQELIDKAHEMGLVLSDEAVDSAVAYTDALDTFKRSMTGVKNKIAAEVLPGFTEVLTGLSELMIGEEGASEKIQNGATMIVDSISGALPKLVDVLMQLILAIAEIAPQIIAALITGITDNIGALVETASTIMMTLLTAIIENLPAMTEGALQLVLTLAQGILDNLPMIIETALQMIVTLAMGIAEALPELVPAIVETVITIVNVLLQNMDKIIAAALAIIKGLAEGLIAALPTLIQALPKIITTIVTVLTKNLPLIIKTGLQILVALVKGIAQAIPQLVAMLPQIVEAIVKGLGQAIKPVTEIGKNIVKGVWRGITSLGSWLANKVHNFFSGIVNGVKNALGIHSPSKVFANIGENMSAGVGVGFVSAMSDVEKDMQRAIPTHFNLNMNGAVSGLEGVGGSTAHSIDVTIPLTLDGMTLTRIISRIQWNQNTVTVRNLGTV